MISQKQNKQPPKLMHSIFSAYVDIQNPNIQFNSGMTSSLALDN